MSNIADNKKIRSHLKDLFERKKYSKIILKIENISGENERNSFLHNLYGTCKVLSPNRNEKDLLVALDNFKNAYLKGKNTLQGLHSLENFANVSIELENHTNSYDFFLNSVKFYQATIALSFQISKPIFSIGATISAGYLLRHFCIFL